MTKPLFITGTDTNVGKTLIAAGLLVRYAQQGFVTSAMKPVAAGCEAVGDELRNLDAVILQRLATLKFSYAQVNPVALSAACAPHIAAQEEGRRLQLAKIEGYCRGLLINKADVCIIEGAGGWRVPLNSRESMSDLARGLGSPVLLVVGVRLGCLNHALLSAEAILRDGVRIAGWVANCVDPDMPYLEQNIATLHAALPAPCLGVVPYRSDLSDSELIAMASSKLVLPEL
jgi:dethiobiotin synthetase